MANYRAVTLGLPKSGKTAYLSCAISYLLRYDAKWELQDANRDFLNIAKDMENILRSGAWPNKTRSYNRLEFRAEGNAVTITDWMGEMFGALDDFESYRDCPEEMKNQFRDSILKATHLLIFIDGTTIQNHDTIKRIQRCLEGLQSMLEEFHKEGTERKEISFIVTKCDELTSVPAYCDSTGAVSVDLLSQALQEHFSDFFRSIKGLNNWLSYKTYSVSCLPVKEHRCFHLNHGLVATNDWTYEDMKGQLAPITADFIGNDIVKENDWRIGWVFVAVVGSVILAVIGVVIGAVVVGYSGMVFGSVIGGVISGRDGGMIGIEIGGVIGVVIGVVVGAVSGAVSRRELVGNVRRMIVEKRIWWEIGKMIGYVILGIIMLIAAGIAGFIGWIGANIGADLGAGIGAGIGERFGWMFGWGVGGIVWKILMKISGISWIMEKID